MAPKPAASNPPCPTPAFLTRYLNAVSAAVSPNAAFVTTSIIPGAQACDSTNVPPTGRSLVAFENYNGNRGAVGGDTQGVQGCASEQSGPWPSAQSRAEPAALPPLPLSRQSTPTKPGGRSGALVAARSTYAHCSTMSSASSDATASSRRRQRPQPRLAGHIAREGRGAPRTGLKCSTVREKSKREGESTSPSFSKSLLARA